VNWVGWGVENFRFSNFASTFGRFFLLVALMKTSYRKPKSVSKCLSYKGLNISGSGFFAYNFFVYGSKETQFGLKDTPSEWLSFCIVS